MHQARKRRDSFAYRIGFLIFILWGSAEAAEIFTEEKLYQLRSTDLIYFRPKKTGDLLSWSGLIYHFQEKKCYRLEPKEKNIQSFPADCPKDFLLQATEPYEKIADFEQFKKRFLACAKKQDALCLRKLTSRSVQISFGVDGLGDLRDKLYPAWKKENYEELVRLLEKGFGGGDRPEFPFPMQENYMGQRGSFEKRDGGWLLVSYLAGD